MKRKNVTYLIGNHDYMFYHFLLKVGLDFQKRITIKEKLDLSLWIEDGGMETVLEFMQLSMEERQEIFDYLSDAKVCEAIGCNDKTYILAHAGIAAYDESLELSEVDLVDFIFERTDYSERLFQDENKILITGHTPTLLIRSDKQPLIYQGNGHIAIDCGCVYGYKLAAYCIDNGQVEYVDKIK